LASIATSYQLPAKEFEKQYKDYLSGFRDWDQLNHADAWVLFSKNIGTHLSIDEVSLSNGELYTIITNKAAHGKQGALVVMVAGTKSDDVAKVLSRIELIERTQVTEVTLDMSPAMERIVEQSFPRAKLVTDRFHVQQLVSEAIQEVRMTFRRAAIKAENESLKRVREEGVKYVSEVYDNGDTKKQLLARSRHLVFKPASRWHESQRERAEILFKEFPKIKEAYDLSMMFRSCYENARSKEEAKVALEKWYEKVSVSGMEEFVFAADTIQAHEDTILNYFVNRSTNASAESFNAKLKGFRALVRGVGDKKFFIFRICKIYA
jgi:transposase